MYSIALGFLLQNDLYVFGGTFAYGSDDTAPFWVIDVGRYSVHHCNIKQSNFHKTIKLSLGHYQFIIRHSSLLVL